MGFLSSGERLSPIWVKFRTHCEERLESARRQLESNLTLDETNRVRGRIIELRAILKADQDDPQIRPMEF